MGVVVVGGGRRFVLRVGNADEGRLVLVLRKMPINAVVTDIQFSADKPLPERRIVGIEDRLPALVPGQHLGVLFVALRKVLFAEARHHLWVGQIRLFDKFLGRIEDLLFFPMNRDLRFAYLSSAFQNSLSSHDADLLFISIFELFYVSIRTPAIEPHFFASLADSHRSPP